MEASVLDIAVSIPRYYVSHTKLAHARGVDPDKYRVGLGCHEMSVCAPGEDTVTLAAEAAQVLLQRHPGWSDRVGLCIVGTESGVDQAKPVSIYLHQLLKLPSSCRAFEMKHACYAGTAAIQMARAWVQLNPKRCALVVTTDIARYDRYSPGESTQGAGAVAMLIACVPEEQTMLTLSKHSGVYAREVYDFWRPPYQSTAQVKGKFSVSCYLEGLSAAVDDYFAQSGEFAIPEYLLFHVPFPNMARKACRHFYEHLGESDEHVWMRAFENKVEPGLWINRNVGNIYTGSLYLMLAGLCSRRGDALSGQQIALFSYGSGSCSEFFMGRFGGKIPKTRLKELLQWREEVDVQTYERLHDEALALENNHSYRKDLEDLRAPFSFLGIRDHERIYKRNELRVSASVSDEIPLSQANVHV